MYRFVIRENIKHYRKLLETTTAAGERARIHKLLAEECRKAEAHGDWDRCGSVPSGRGCGFDVPPPAGKHSLRPTNQERTSPDPRTMD